MKSKIDNEELLREVVKKSINLKNTLTNLEMMDNGKNYQTLNKYIKLFNIDISHFESRSDLLKRIKFINKKYKLEDILVKDFKGSLTGNNIKDKLYKAGLKQPICELCGQGEIWQGKKISLILDHIDGYHDNMEITNIRIVCPNCNATLETHCRGNKRQRKEIIIENIKIIKNNDNTFSKEKLYNLIKNIDFKKYGWRIPMSKVVNRTPQYCAKLLERNFPEIWKIAWKNKDYK